MQKTPTKTQPPRIRRYGERRSVSRSASRALDILEFVGEIGRPFRAIEIVKRMDLHPATVDQLLKTLVSSSHLVFDAQRKTYVPSPRLAGFSTWMVRHYRPHERLHAMLCEVQAATGGGVTLTTANDLFMQIIDAADESTFPMSERGLQVSLFGSAAVGAAYLSLIPDAEIRLLAARARIAEPETRAILAKVSHIRNDGYATGSSADGSFWSIAMPLPQGEAPVPLVLGIAHAGDRMPDKQSEFRGIMNSAVSRWKTALAGAA